MMSARTIIAAVAAVLLAAACSTTPTPAPTASSPPPAAAPALPTASPSPLPPPPARTAEPQPAVAATSLPAHLDPKSAISTQRSVYFDYDDSSIKSQYAPVIDLQGRYLAANPSLSIRIEGNADERGSSEYNLALGQKRADVVRRALRVYGVRDAQTESVSWGKEKPRATGHDEAAWAENRRVDVVYPNR